MPSTSSLLSLRLASHRLTPNEAFKSPAEMIQHYGCIQAQDTNQALWGIGSRVAGSTENSVLEAIRHREIVRTWPMRGTLHYMTPQLVRPLLKLAASKTLSGFPKRREFLGISDSVAEDALKIMQQNLRGGKSLTRSELTETLKQNGIPMQTQWTYHLTCYAGTLGLICFWAPTETEESFVLLDEWIPETKSFSDDEAMTEIALAYFRGHSPATIDDFAWWTGLGKTEIKKTLSHISERFNTIEHAGKTYYFLKETKEIKPQWVHFIGGFDEYFLGYKDRSIVADVTHYEKLFTKNGIFFPLIIENGEIVGVWKRSFKKDTIIFTIELLPWKNPEKKLLESEAERYSKFMGYQKFEIKKG